MKDIKRYACHRVYDGYNHYLSQSVVAIAPDGEVLECKPLTEETSFTEWIGGVIFLTTTDEAPCGDFHSWAKQQKNGQIPVYAWHLSEFDFEREEPTPNCIIRRL